METNVGYTRKNAPYGCEKICLSFEVESVGETYKLLTARGVAFIKEPHEWDGAMVAHVSDPEDNVIEFYAWTEE